MAEWTKKVDDKGRVFYMSAFKSPDGTARRMLPTKAEAKVADRAYETRNLKE